jgi:hypothetical protein
MIRKFLPLAAYVVAEPYLIHEVATFIEALWASTGPGNGDQVAGWSRRVPISAIVAEESH